MGLSVYPPVSGGAGGTGFNLDIGSSGNTTFEFSSSNPAGGYSIISQLADSTIEFYAVAEDGTLAGYTNTKALAATKPFNKMVVYGASNNDLITFEFKPTTLPSASGNLDSGAAPFIDSISDADLASIDDTTIITGGNFATDVTVTFTGTDAVVRNPKSVVRTNSTQLIVTRPDDFLEDNAPYTITVSNPGIPQSAYKTFTFLVTAGGDPVWVTPAGALPTASGVYSVTLEATDPDGGAITYAVVAGQLPTGLSLNSSTGEISGTATGGSQSFTISATDPEGNITNRSFDLSTILVSGGDISVSGGYVYHTFTSNGTLTANIGVTADVLVVAGGGAGGVGSGNGSSVEGAGGGAGGYIAQSMVLAVGSYPIEVGAGGTSISNGANITGPSGTNSTFNSLIAYGGGGGATRVSPGMTSGANGGSGGGGGYTGDSGGSSAGTGTPGQGNNGGAGQTGNPYSGGGGGASSAGASAPGGGHGGSGSQWLNGSYYAGGGGRGPGDFSAAGNGGIGGGGDGLNATSSESGTINTGGGGGGGRANALGSGSSGAGGSGIVIVRYPI